AVLLALFPLTRVIGSIATSDALLTALVAGCAAASVLWSRRLADARAFSLGGSLCCGVLAGLLFDTKITGAAELGLLAASAGLAVLEHPKDKRLRRAAALSLVAAVSAAVFVAIAANPSLWHAPLRTAAAMFESRVNTVRAQSVVFFWHFFQTYRDQLWG